MAVGDYITLEELSDWLRKTTDSGYVGADDTDLQRAVTASKRVIDSYCRRDFNISGSSQATETRLFTAEWDRCRNRWVCEIDDISDVTSLGVTFNGTVTIDYQLLPLNAAAHDKPYTHILFGSGVTGTWDEGGVEVDAVFGWLEVPEVVKEASLIQAAKFYNRRDSMLGESGSPEFGGVASVSKYVERDVQLLLNTVKRYWGAAR